VTPTRANDAEPAEIPADIDNGDWPPEEPPIGWEQFARNWQDTARLCAGNADYWRERAETAERERDSLARRLAVRFEETQAAYSVIARMLVGWKPDGASWWRNSGTTQELITEAEHRALRAATEVSS
jgi:hypothetical protein